MEPRFGRLLTGVLINPPGTTEHHQAFFFCARHFFFCATASPPLPYVQADNSSQAIFNHYLHEPKYHFQVATSTQDQEEAVPLCQARI